MIALAIVPMAQAAEGKKPKNECNDARQGIKFYRDNTWIAEQSLGMRRTPTDFAERSIGCKYVRWAAKLWQQRSKGVNTKLRSINADPRKAICFVFGEYCSQALRVSSCETGGTYHIGATNGQYLGLFQMGNYARSNYGHGYTALEQARAAYAYFVNSGRDWSPWSCKP